MSQYILDCTGTDPTCTISNYSPPPATVYEYALGPTWVYGCIFVAVVIAVIAYAIVTYGRIEEGDTWGKRRLEGKRAELEARARIAEAHNTCVACGTRYAPTLEDIKT